MVSDFIYLEKEPPSEPLKVAQKVAQKVATIVPLLTEQR